MFVKAGGIGILISKERGNGSVSFKASKPNTSLKSFLEGSPQKMVLEYIGTFLCLRNGCSQLNWMQGSGIFDTSLSFSKTTIRLEEWAVVARIRTRLVTVFQLENMKM